MPSLNITMKSGSKGESLVADVTRRYLNKAYYNVRIPTCLTSSGDTEIDLIAAVSDMIMIVESKNLSSIRGEYSKWNWTLRGASGSVDGTDDYSALNIFTQNRLHVKALKSLWFTKFKRYPDVVALIVVPNNCDFPAEFKNYGMCTISEYDALLATSKDDKVVEKYSLDYFISDLK